MIKDLHVFKRRVRELERRVKASKKDPPAAG
jgi:hypothetical protein